MKKYYIPNFSKGVVDAASGVKLSDDYKQKLAKGENVYITDGDALKVRPSLKHATPDTPNLLDAITRDGLFFGLQNVTKQNIRDDIEFYKRTVLPSSSYVIQQSFALTVLDALTFDADKDAYVANLELVSTGNPNNDSAITNLATALGVTVNDISIRADIHWSVKQIIVREDNADGEYVEGYTFLIDKSRYYFVNNTKSEGDATREWPIWLTDLTETTGMSTLISFISDKGLVDYYPSRLFIKHNRGRSPAVVQSAAINPVDTVITKKSENYDISKSSSTTPKSSSLNIRLRSTGFNCRSFKKFINQDLSSIKNIQRLFLDDDGTPSFFFSGIQYRYLGGLNSVLSGSDLFPTNVGMDINDIRKLVSDGNILDKPTIPIKALVYTNADSTSGYRNIEQGLTAINQVGLNTFVQRLFGLNFFDAGSKGANYSDYYLKKDETNTTPLRSFIDNISSGALVQKFPAMSEIVSNVKEVIGVYDPKSNPVSSVTGVEITQQGRVHLYPDIKYLHENSDTAFYGFKELNDGTKVTIHPSAPGWSITQEVDGERTGVTPISKQTSSEEALPNGNGFTVDGFGVTVLVHTDDYEPPTTKQNGVGLSKVRLVIFLYYDYSTLDFKQYFEDKKLISTISPTGSNETSSYTPILYSFLRDAINSPDETFPIYPFNAADFVNFTNIRTTAATIDTTTYDTLSTGQEGKYSADDSSKNKLYWPCGDASFMQYYAPVFNASKLTTMFPAYSYHAYNGDVNVLPYYSSTNSTRSAALPIYLSNIYRPADTVVNSATFPTSSQSTLSYGYNLQAYHAKPTFYTFSRDDFKNLLGRNALVDGNKVNFSEAGIERQNFYSDAVSHYFNGLFPGTESTPIFRSLGLSFNNFPTKEPGEQPYTQEFFSLLSHEETPVKDIVTRSPEEAIVVTTEGVYNTVGNFLNQFVFKQVSRTGMDTEIEDDSNALTGIKKNTLVRIGYSEEGGGFITNVLNTESKDLELITNIVPLLSRHRIILGYTPGSNIVHCFSFANNRQYKGVTKWVFQYPIVKMGAIDDGRIRVISDVSVHSRDNSVATTQGILDFDDNLATITPEDNFRDEYWLPPFGGNYETGEGFEFHDVNYEFETLPVLELNADNFSAYTNINIAGVSIFVDGFPDFRVQIVGNTTSSEYDIRATNRDNVSLVDRFSGALNLRTLQFASVQPRIRIKGVANKPVAFTSMVVNIKGGNHG